MIKFENECVGCPAGMGCLGSSCPHTNVPHLFCDSCGDEAEKLYDTSDGQLCEECAGSDKEDYTVIDGDNAYEFTSPEEQYDYYNYADLAYEKKRDERSMEDG